MATFYVEVGDAVGINGKLNLAYNNYTVYFEATDPKGKITTTKYYYGADFTFPDDTKLLELVFQSNNAKTAPFISAQRNGVNIPFKADFWWIDLTANPVEPGGSIKVLVKCKQPANEPDFILTVGDTIDSNGDVSIPGTPKYTTALWRSYRDGMRGGTYSEVTPFDPKKPLNIKNSNIWDTFQLIVTAIEPDSITSASCNGEEVVFTPEKIDHTLTRAQKLPNPATARRFFIEAGKKNPQPTLRQSINLNYRVNREELKEFQKKVFDTFIVTLPGGDKPDEAYVWSFVSNLYLLPFPLPQDQIFARELIQARDKEFNAADRIVGDYIYVDLGNITVPEVHKNSLDYVGTQVDLYVPFKSEPISLDPFQVVGENLTIQLVVGVSHGDSTLNVSLDNGELISTTSYDLGSKYPFFSYRKMIDNDFQLKNVINSNRKAYVTVKRADYTDVVLPLVELEGKIGEESKPVKGRVVFNEIELEGIPYADEHFTLISKLTNGVIFK